MIPLLSFGCQSIMPDADSPVPAQNTAATRPASDATIPWSVVKLDRQLPRLIRHFHWAKLNSDNQLSALRFQAITPDARHVLITAQTVAEGGCAVQIRIGYFGTDTQLQDQFLNYLVQQTRQGNHP